MRSAKYFLLFLTLGAVLIGCDSSDSLVFPVLPNPTPADAQTYAGSTVCRTCHQAIYESWEKTRHTKKVRVASLQTVVNDVDTNGTNDFVQGGAGATFDLGTSVPASQTTWDDWSLGAGVAYPKLGWDGANLVIRVGPVTYPVTFVLGGTGKWKQRYMVTIDNQEYISPVQYNEVTREYVPYDPEHWYTISGNTLTGYLYNSAAQTPVSTGNTRNSWQRRCIGCHVTGVRDISLNADGEYGDDINDMLAGTQGDGPWFSEMPVACESCHGPAARHVELGGGIGTALNPAVLASDRSDEVCGSCHNRGTSTNSEGLGYPWAEGPLVDGQFHPGDVLGDFYDYVPKDGTRFWQDGAQHAKSHHQQWLDHRDTPHAKAGVKCSACHSAHGSGIEGDLKMEPTQLCLSCHDGKGNIDSSDLSLHTRHNLPEAQACNNCHFNLTAKSAINYDIHSHTYRIIFPVESETTPGLTNSCAKCHQNETTSQLTGMLSARWPDIHPVAYARSQANPFGVGFNLLGNMSIDPLGGPLTYQWSLKSGPPNFSQNDLIGATADSALFVPSAPGLYTFMLTVTNRDGLRSWVAETTVDVPDSIVQTPPDLTQSFYVGSNVCSACHSGTHSSWEVTRHTMKVRRPTEGPGVVFADTDTNGTNDWMQGGFDVEDDPDSDRTTFDDYVWSGASPPVIDFGGGTYTVELGPNTYDVTFVLGGTGKWKQRYMATIDNQEYILPVQYNELTNEWVPYDLEHWYTFTDGNGNGTVDPGETITGYLYGSGDTPVDLGNTRNSWQRRCTACHVTGAVDLTLNADDEYGLSIETMLAATTGPRIAEMGIGCEACHGPASQHASLPTLRGAIINPSKLSSLRSNEVCAACHNRGTSTNSEGLGFPWGMDLDGGNFLPGVHDLDDYYTSVPEGGSRFWDDPFGHSKSHHQQWLDMRWSKHFNKAGMTCATCHTGHNNNLAGQLKTEQVALCTSCHQGFRDTNNDNRYVNHSRHFPGMAKCSDCHQPKVAKSAINYDIGAHSWRIIWPEATENVGIPNSCNTCHDESPDDIQDAINELWGDLLPYAEPRVVDFGDGGKLKRDVGFTAPATITLDGSKSYDPNGSRIATYSWTILSAPAGNNAKLTNRSSARTTISVVVPGTYVFSLTVSDLEGTSQPETVTVVVE